MTYTVVALLRCKEGIPSSQFRTYYDTVHLPLLKSLVGSSMPLTHTRYYVSRKTATVLKSANSMTSTTTLERAMASSEDLYPTVMYRGSPSDVAFDSVTVMTWEDKESWDTFLKILRSKGVAEKIGKDEDNFLDRERKVVFSIAESITTMRE
ncbi:hypothetical protein F4819DRAFT_405840 [Hypoxylon fuscum]|nr:hypothetical protein F4819DRAFT_405840 [Hypoxylon fuscum]